MKIRRSMSGTSPKVEAPAPVGSGIESKPFRPQILAVIAVMGGIAGALVAIIWFPPLVLPKEAWAVIGVVLNGLSMLGIKIIDSERKDEQIIEVVREMMRRLKND